MIYNSYECPVCGKDKPRNRRICYACFETYGSSAADWPSWVRDAVNRYARSRTAYINKVKHEIQVGLFEDWGTGLRPKVDIPLKTSDELAQAYLPDRCGNLMLPYAPYEDEEMNRQYRKANGIKSKKPKTRNIRLQSDAEIITNQFIRGGIEEDYISHEITEQSFVAVWPELTDRQKRILQLSQDGFTQNEIADMLGVSQSTVSEHYKKARAKIEQTAKPIFT